MHQAQKRDSSFKMQKDSTPNPAEALERTAASIEAEMLTLLMLLHQVLLLGLLVLRHHLLQASPWILDSGASFHMTPDSTSLTSVGPPVFPISVQTADGTPLAVSSQGTLLSTDFSVPVVSHVPQLTMQLLSVGQLTDLGCRVGFDSHTCFVQDR